LTPVKKVAEYFIASMRMFKAEVTKKNEKSPYHG